MKRPHFFLSSRSHSVDLLASELVMTIGDQFPKSEFIGVLGKYTQKTRAEALITLDALLENVKVEGLDKGLNALKTMVEENLPQMAILFGYSKIHHEIAGFLKDKGVPVVLFEVTPGFALQGVPAHEAHDRIKTALSIHKSGSAFLRNAHIPFQYVGTPFRDRISKVIVKKSDFDFLSGKPLITFFPGGYGETLDKMIPKFGPLAEAITKELDCQIVVSLREEVDVAAVELKMKAVLPKESLVHFVLGMHLELLSLSTLAITGSGAISIEAAITGVPAITMFDQGEAPDELGYYSLVNQSLGQRLFPEFPSDASVKPFLDAVRKLLGESPERTEMLLKLKAVKSEFQGSAIDNAADYIIHEAGLRVKKPRSSAGPVS